MQLVDGVLGGVRRSRRQPWPVIDGDATDASPTNASPTTTTTTTGDSATDGAIIRSVIRISIGGGGGGGHDAFDAQQFAQARDLFLEFADQFGVGVLVHHGLAHDLLGPVGVPSFA